jgi:hypothetical protein
MFGHNKKPDIRQSITTMDNICKTKTERIKVSVAFSSTTFPAWWATTLDRRWIPQNTKGRGLLLLQE